MAKSVPRVLHRRAATPAAPHIVAFLDCRALIIDIIIILNVGHHVLIIYLFFFFFKDDWASEYTLCNRLFFSTVDKDGEAAMLAKFGEQSRFFTISVMLATIMRAKQAYDTCASLCYIKMLSPRDVEDVIFCLSRRMLGVM